MKVFYLNFVILKCFCSESENETLKRVQGDRIGVAFVAGLIYQTPFTVYISYDVKSIQ